MRKQSIERRGESSVSGENVIAQPGRLTQPTPHPHPNYWRYLLEGQGEM